MDTMILAARSREAGHAQRERREGYVPAVVYGKKEASASVSVSEKEFRKLYSAIGETTVFDLVVEKGKTYHVLVRDVEFHPISGEVMHVDFYAISMTEAVEASVELEYVGEAPAVKEQGGTLVRSLDELNVKALPGDLPPSIPVDVSVLKTFEDMIHVKDLGVSGKVEILADSETAVAFVAKPRTEEEEDLTDEAPDVSKVEVEEKGKKEEEETEEK